MTRRDRVGLYGFVAFSLFICVESWRLGLGTFRHPGPGFLPFGAASIIIVLAIVQLMKARGKVLVSIEPLFKRERLFKFLCVVSICFGYGLLFYFVGFVLCTGLFVFIALKTIEPKGWGKTLFISAATAFVAYLLFDYWLQIQTPKGEWVYPIYQRIGGYLWK